MNIQEFRDENRDKYVGTELTDRVHGLGIKTELDWIDLDELDVKEAEYTYEPTHLFEDEKIHILDLETLSNTKEKWKSRIKQHLFDLRLEEPEKIDYLHNAESKVRIIVIPEGTEIDEAIWLNKETFGDHLEHTFIYVGDDADVDILYEVEGNQDKDVDMITDVVQLYIGDGADVEFTNVKEMPNNYYVHGRNQATIMDDADFHFATADFGGRLITNEANAFMKGEDSHVLTDNLFYGEDDEEFDINGASIHNGESCYSFLRGKGVIEKAKATSRGLVRVEKPAFDSDGYQKADILKLSDGARAITIPDLEIENHAVRCSHGSTISKIQDMEVFYMQSRGIDRKTAENKIVEGFYNPILENFESETIREDIVERINERIYR